MNAHVHPSFRSYSRSVAVEPGRSASLAVIGPSDGVCPLFAGRFLQQMLAGRQASTQPQSPERAAPGARTLANTNPRSAAGWWRECALRGQRCSETLLMSLCGHAVFSACHHGWDSAACLLLRMHWHFSGAYPRILLSGWRLNEALPRDWGRKLHHPSGALLCAGCHSNCYCKYRTRVLCCRAPESTSCLPFLLFPVLLGLTSG